MSADQVLRALWRRKGVVAVVTAGALAVGAAFILALPNQYKATAVIRVEPQRPSADLVQRTVSELLEDRLLTVRQELFARPVLESVIRELQLYPAVVSKRGMDAAVEQMRQDLDVKVEGDNAFEVTYTAPDPQLAAKVANRLPQIFAEDTARVRRQQAERATQVFGDELTRLQKSLGDWEGRIAQFKVAHAGELPEQLETNMRTLERLGMQLNNRSDELRIAENRRSEMFRAGLAADSEAGRLKAAEDDTQKKLVEAQAEWTSDHPEVQRLGRELGTLQVKRKAAEGQLWMERQERARAAAMVAQVQKEIADLRKQADEYQRRLEETPRWAQGLSVMQRDYEVVKQKYQSVISRQVEAEIAQDMEIKGANGMFNVLSLAAVPSAPAKPDRMGGLLICLLVALGLGILTGVVLEMRDESIRDAQEIKERLPLPVLAVVPQLSGRAERRVLTPAARQAGTTIN